MGIFFKKMLNSPLIFKHQSPMTFNLRQTTKIALIIITRVKYLQISQVTRLEAIPKYYKKDWTHVSVGLHLQPAIQFKEVPMGRDLFRLQRLWFRKKLVYKTEYLLRRTFNLMLLSHWLSNDIAESKSIILKVL